MVKISPETIRGLAVILLARVNGDFTNFLTEFNASDSSIHYLVMEHF